MTLTYSKPQPRAPIITIFGDAGVGKNSLASAIARNPIVIRAEDGVQRQTKKLEMPNAFPPCTKGQDIFDQLKWLLREEHEFTDLIFDSGSAADALFVADVLETGGKNGKPAQSLATACGGFGAGFGAVAASHGRVRKAAGLLNERKNMTIIFLLHADLETMKLPDMDDYQRWSLRLSSSKSVSSVPFYVDSVDLVGHVRLQSALRGDDDERKKVVSNGDRELVCHATASSVTKNGLGITEPLDFEEGTNPLAPYLWPEKKVVGKAKSPKEEEVDPSDFEGE